MSLRLSRRCASVGCSFLVHEQLEFGDYCCKRCERTPGTHGKRCQGRLIEGVSLETGPPTGEQQAADWPTQASSCFQGFEQEIENIEVFRLGLDEWSVLVVRCEQEKQAVFQSAANFMQEVVTDGGPPDKEELHEKAQEGWKAMLLERLQREIGYEPFTLACDPCMPDKWLCGVGAGSSKVKRTRASNLALALGACTELSEKSPELQKVWHHVRIRELGASGSDMGVSSRRHSKRAASRSTSRPKARRRREPPWRCHDSDEGSHSEETQDSQVNFPEARPAESHRDLVPTSKCKIGPSSKSEAGNLRELFFKNGLTHTVIDSILKAEPCLNSVTTFALAVATEAEAIRWVEDDLKLQGLVAKKCFIAAWREAKTGIGPMPPSSAPPVPKPRPKPRPKPSSSPGSEAATVEGPRPPSSAPPLRLLAQHSRDDSVEGEMDPAHELRFDEAMEQVATSHTRLSNAPPLFTAQGQQWHQEHEADFAQDFRQVMMDAVPTLTLVNVSDVGYIQDSIKAHFSDGRPLSELVSDLNSGRQRADLMPPLNIIDWPMRGLFTLDHRRLWCLKQHQWTVSYTVQIMANVYRLPVAFEQIYQSNPIIQEFMRKFGTRNSGQSVEVRAHR